MSIQSEINRIAGAKSDIADAIEGQGVTVPSGTKLDGMANLIGQISGGSGKLNSTQAADAYDPTATYAVGDKVSYAGNVYSCISAISTPEAWDSTHWDQVDPIQDQVDDVRNTLNAKPDINLGITGASVEQIIKVLTVDANGKPLTWQAVNLPSNEVSVITNANTTLTLQPCPVTYKWGEVASLTLTVTATSQYHFMFTCPSASATVLTLSGHTGTTGDTLAAGKTYEVDVWAGIALIHAVEITAVTP